MFMCSGAVNKELKNIYDWFCANKLALNVTKTNVVIFNRNEDKVNNFPNLYLGNSKIQRVSKSSETPAVRMLGIYLDPQLNFDFYTNSLIKRINSSIFILNKAKNILSEKSKLLLYYALIHSHLHFSSLIIAMSSRNSRENLLKCQKRALRIIANKGTNRHSMTYFNNYDILPLPCLVDMNIIRFMLEVKIGVAPSTFNLESWFSHDIHNYELRENNKYYIPRINFASCEKLSLFYYPKLWNSLPNEYLLDLYPKTFLPKIKTYLRDNYTENNQCRINNCILCQV